MGTYSGVILSDNVTQKTINQELETAVEGTVAVHSDVSATEATAIGNLDSGTVGQVLTSPGGGGAATMQDAAGGGIAAVVDDTSPQLGGFLDTNSFMIHMSKGTDAASASNLVLTHTGNEFDITGTTTIDTINGHLVGTVVILQFDDALTLSHDAVDLILPNAEDIVTVAGDVATFYEYAAADWRLIGYQAMDSSVIRARVIITGSTTVSSDSETVLATFLVTDGWVPAAFVSITDDVVFGIYQGNTANAPATDDNAIYMLKKTATANQYTLNIRQQDSGSSDRDFDWGVRESR